MYASSIYSYLGLLGSPSLLFSLVPLTPHTVNLSLAFSRSELDNEGSTVSTFTEHHFEEF